MNKILKHIPGFRSGKKRNKILASVFYAFIILMSAIVGGDFFFTIGGLGLLIISIVDLVKTKKQKLPIKIPIISLVVAIVLMGVGIELSDNRNEIAKVDGKKDVAEIVKEDKLEKVPEINSDVELDDGVDVDLDVNVDLDVEFTDGEAIITITTNAVDGSIFETLIMDSDFNSISSFISVEDGKGVKTLDINQDWEVEYLSAISTMRFNLEEHPQPEAVKKAYGDTGENLIGSFAVENNLGGYNVTMDAKVIPYPDEETLSKKQDELFAAAINELIESSNGVIVKIQPYFDAGDWSSAVVTVDDAWYNSQEHEKERFAESVAETVRNVIVNTGKASNDKTIPVYFYDTYQKELASPKMMGGYKIKR